jgi:hypothetical protein
LRPANGKCSPAGLFAWSCRIVDIETNGSARRSAVACRSMAESLFLRRCSSAPTVGGKRSSFGRSATMASIFQHGVQHVTSNYHGAFIGGGTRAQFRCDGAGGWRGRRRWWSRRCERRIWNHRQLTRLDEWYERQQRCSTAQRPKQPNWQYCCSTARQYGPK